MPAGRLRARPDQRSRASAARTRSRPRARRARRARRSRAARGSSRDARPDAVLGGGGYVAGPGRRSPRCCAKIPLVLTEADSPPRPRQPPARAAARAASASPSRSRAATAPRYRVTGRAGPAAPITDRAARPRAASASAPDETLRARLRRLARRALDQPGRARGVRGRAVPRRCTSPARATSRPAARPGPHYVLRDYLDAVRRCAGRGRPRRRPRRRLGLRARPVRPPGGADPVPARAADHQTANARWMAERRGGGRPPRRRADAGAPARDRRRRCSTTATRLAAMRAGLGRASPARTPPATSRAQVLAAAGRRTRS